MPQRRAESVLTDLDELTTMTKRFQTRADWEVECKARWQRYQNILIAGGIGLTVGAITADMRMKQRQFDFSQTALRPWFAMLYRSRTPKLRRGPFRSLVIGSSVLLSWHLMQHSTENRRLNGYLQNQTVHGEMARNLVSGLPPFNGFEKSFPSVSLFQSSPYKQDNPFSDKATKWFQ
eukprot:NODE_5829_length_674_cov_78.758684_g5806_i0.p1 GENE.NODE_5829_length_674_cov_78.758684_g5806_i0~~NODE_5829_length_674_cov_78.758684_g5806_i0.p1  ORF type:complete len:177 (-),score=37.07 NODE_5829_length_674_cov_78.758684_g5806_i0:82-612(-)